MIAQIGAEWPTLMFGEELQLNPNSTYLNKNVSISEFKKDVLITVHFLHAVANPVYKYMHSNQLANVSHQSLNNGSKLLMYYTKS